MVYISMSFICCTYNDKLPKEKIYPISYDSYLEYQLSTINFLRKNDINSFLLYNNTESIFKIIKNNIDKMKEIINKEGTIEIGK